MPWEFEEEVILANIVLWDFEEDNPVFRSSPEDAEVHKGHNDYVEPPDEDVEETDGVVGGQVDVGTGVQEVGVVLPHLNNDNSKWESPSIATNQTDV